MNKKYLYDAVIPDIYLDQNSFLTLEDLDDDGPFNFDKYTNRGKRGGRR